MIINILNTKLILQNLAKETGLPINHLRVLLALERAVIRLEHHTTLSKHLIFKGGFALLKEIGTSRYTKDVDALASDINKEIIAKHIKEALSHDLEDGFWFGDVIERELTIDGNYGGLRFDCAFYIGAPMNDKIKVKKLSRFQLDIGFGDVVPKLLKQKMPTWVPTSEPISWFVYPLEYMLSEKLETLCRRGSANSRAKDIFDLIELFPRCRDKKALLKAIQMTFRNRQTEIPKSFYDFFNELHPDVLRAAWDSILAPKKIFFDGAWSDLSRHLQILDADRDT